MPKGVKRGSYENDKDGTVAKHYLLQGGRTSLWLLLSVLLRQVGMSPALGKKVSGLHRRGLVVAKSNTVSRWSGPDSPSLFQT